MSLLEAEPVIVSPEWIVERLAGRGAYEIGAGLERLIRSGELAAGGQLPTIRDLAKAAAVSVGTVLVAWNYLREHDLIETRRRGGTTVKARALPNASPAPGSGWADLDFQQGAPDISLQPDLSKALLDSLTARDLNVFGRDYMTDRLHDAVSSRWPFPAESWATAGGGTEALLLATASAAEPGAVVAVDEPVSPGFLDTLRDLGLFPVGVRSDAEGPLPDSLTEALRAGASAFILQPGAPFAVDYALSERRAAELAEAILSHPGEVAVVEDDSIGPLMVEEPPTLGNLLPQKVIRVRSYCKAYGIDVRTSVLGGSAELVERAISLRSHGVGSNSRILQNTLAYLIGDDDANARVADARERYTRRRALFAEALTRRGVVTHAGPNSIVLWVEVAGETDALVDLASKGILAGAGSKSFVSPRERDLIRISPLQVPDDDPALFDRLAALIQAAAKGVRREFFD